MNLADAIKVNTCDPLGSCQWYSGRISGDDGDLFYPMLMGQNTCTHGKTKNKMKAQSLKKF